MSIPNGTELLIILAIVLLLFGVGRLSRIGGELGRGISEFRKGLRGDDQDKRETQAPEGEHNPPPK